MFTVHFDAFLLPTEMQTSDYALGQDKIPAVNVSASRDKADKVHVTLCNLNPNAAEEVACELNGAKATRLAGRVLTASQITAHNTFAAPETVKPAEFNEYKLTPQGFSVTLPPKSVVVLEVE